MKKGMTAKMIYDFDKVTDRKNTNSLKYDFASERGKREDLLPLWVADMDFQTPPGVIEALVRSANHGIFGYSDVKESYFKAVSDWFINYFGYETRPEWLVKTPGVVFALAAAVRAFTDEGDGVLIQRPVYYPFSGVIRDNNRKIINSPLVYENGEYHIDFEDFEKKIRDNNVRLFLLCSPHNPVGRAWTPPELKAMGDICVKYGVKVISDDIHCDFVFEPHKHSVFSEISADFAGISVICTAPSKTFNLAGLQASNIFIQNETLREEFIREYRKTGYSQLNSMGLAACESAYRYGGEWLRQLKVYLMGNIKLVADFCERTGIKLIPVQGTYLVWLDFSPLGMSDKETDLLIENKAGIWLDTGLMFGREGSGFQRMNIACPRAFLEEALTRLEFQIKN
jgi:cystathionine beta-lyase